MKNKKLMWSAIFTLTGTVIGAGILGIPFVVIRSGFWTGVLAIIFIGLIMTIINLLISEVSLRQKKVNQLVGYTEKYAGNFGKWLMVGAMVITCYGALTAYTLGVSESLLAIFGFSQLFWAVVFYVIMIFILFGGIKYLANSEFFLEIFKFSIFAIIVIIIFASSKFTLNNLKGFHIPNFFLPFGVVLFAFLGATAIPELREMLKTDLKTFKKNIIIGSLIPIAVYILFSASIIGVSGLLTTEVATIGVGKVFGGFAIVLFNLFAILAMSTSFIAIGYALKQMFMEDFNLKNFDAWVLTLVIPVLLLSVGVYSFIKVLDVSGAIAGSIMGILIIFIHFKARKTGNRKPEFIIKIPLIAYILLAAFFIIGLLYNLFFIF